MSLIELVVVIAIVGALLAIGIPEYGRFAAKNRIRRAANDLIQEMRLTRTIAILQNREYLMVFDPDPDSDSSTHDDKYLIGFDGDGDKKLLRIRTKITYVLDNSLLRSCSALFQS